MICANPKCGKEFEVVVSNKKYCNRKCRRRDHYIRHRESILLAAAEYDKKHRRKTEPKIRVCANPNCCNEFTLHPMGHDARKKFCCQECKKTDLDTIKKKQIWSLHARLRFKSRNPQYNSSYGRKYRKDHLDEIKHKSRAYYLNNKDRLREKQHTYYQVNTKKIRAYRRSMVVNLDDRYVRRVMLSQGLRPRNQYDIEVHKTNIKLKRKINEVQRQLNPR